MVLGVGRSLTGRRWLWSDAEDRVALGLAQRLDVPELVGRVLAARGVGVEGAAHFLEPTLRALLPDPSSLADMDAAAERIARAAAAGETVGVFGDYDVDGACSGAIMALLLRGLGCPVLTHVPDRAREGYGPNAPALQSLARRGASLVICVDCGTAAEEQLACLRGCADVVVLDHHKAEGPPPAVVATVNPNRLDCGSGLAHLCAAGVAFLTAVAVVRALRRTGFFLARAEPDLIAMLDLVALATVCDVMPLTGLNRALVAQGLKVMARRERPGMAALLEVAQAARPHERPNAFTLGFGLGPRINAAGRVGESDLGLRLLLCDDADEARALARRLDALNATRQEVEAAMLDDAMAQAAGQAGQGRPTLLAFGERWHPGVAGIVAGRIKERHNRPACVAAVSDGLAKGSGRSVSGLDLGAAVIAARQAGILATGGGHAMAAGFSLPVERLAEFHAFLDDRLAAASGLPSAADLQIEGTLSVAAATAELARHVVRLAPFGPGNAEPTFVLRHARVTRADRVGREGGHGPRVRGGRGRRPAEGDAVPRRRRCAGRRAAGAARRAAAHRRPPARRGVERHGRRRLLRLRRGPRGLTARTLTVGRPSATRCASVPFV